MNDAFKNLQKQKMTNIQKNNKSVITRLGVE